MAKKVNDDIIKTKLNIELEKLETVVYYYTNPFTNVSVELESHKLSAYLIGEELENLGHTTIEAKQKVIKNFNNNLDNLAYVLGKNSIRFFVLYYLRHIFIPSENNTNRNLSKEHYILLDQLQDQFINNKQNKAQYVLPRGFAKTTVINISLLTHQHCYGLSPYSILIVNKESDGIDFLSSIKNLLRNPFIIKSFGELLPSQAPHNLTSEKEKLVNKAEEVELTNHTKIKVFSWGSSVRGTNYKSVRPKVIILDDVLKEENILTEESRKKGVTKLYKEIIEVGDKEVVRGGKVITPSSKFVILGTPLAKDDLIDVVRKDPTFSKHIRGVVDFDVDHYFQTNKYWLNFKDMLFNRKDTDALNTAIRYYQENVEEMQFETIWEKFTCIEIAQKYYCNRLEFMSELMCNVDTLGEEWITNIAQLDQTEIEAEKFEKTILSIDPASTKSKKGDSYGFTILSKSKGFYYVRKGILKKWDATKEFDKYIDFVIDLLISNKDITHIVVEKNVYKGVDAAEIQKKIDSSRELKKRKIKIILIYNTTNKDQRISTIVDKINSGTIIFNKSCTDYNIEVKNFKGQRFTAHDDSIDSLEMAVNEIDKIKINKQCRVVSKAEFMQRKGVRF